MKTCRSCGVEYPEMFFRKQPNPRTLRKECKKCEALASRQYREKIDADPELRERRLAKQAQYRKRNPERVRAYQREYHAAYRKSLRAWGSSPEHEDG